MKLTPESIIKFGCLEGTYHQALEIYNMLLITDQKDKDSKTYKSWLASKPTEFKWCIKLTEGNMLMLQKYGGSAFIHSGGFCYPGEEFLRWSLHIPDGFEEITTTEFKKYIFKDIKVLPEKWYILRTNENGKELNKFLNEKLNSFNYNHVPMIGENDLIKNDFTGHDIEQKLEGYTEITFEQLKRLWYEK